jgi:hypothetical protein
MARSPARFQDMASCSLRFDAAVPALVLAFSTPEIPLPRPWGMLGFVIKLAEIGSALRLPSNMAMPPYRPEEQ